VQSVPKTLQKANRSCGRARTATSTVDRGFTGYLLEDWVVVFSFDVGCWMFDVRCSSFKALMGIRRGSAIRPATQNPAKGKPLLSRAGDISLNSLTEAPVVFPAFAVGETASPQAQRKANAEGGRTSPMSKASENKGLNGGSEKKCPLPVNGCWISNAFFCIPGIAY